jgi:trehalose 6-phosphate synthase/phosphatase
MNVAPTERLVVLSNRLPVAFRRAQGRLVAERSPGGLVAALDATLQRTGGTWIGWPGMRLGDEDLASLRGGSEPYEIEALQLGETEVKRYLHGLSNAALWPLFHSFPERTRFDRRDWESYEAVNARFAQAAIAAGEPGALIWLHDYHLMRAALHIRRVLADARIAFFLHIPFPCYDIFRIFPWSRELLLGLLSCDLIGFHSAGYVRNFLDCAERLLAARVDYGASLVELGSRTVRVGAYPLGIDYGHFERLARAEPRGPDRGAEKIVLGVDRLDYTKGIPERMRAFERLLEVHPEHRERAVLLQIAVPSRDQVPEYQRLKREIDELVGRINGRFATSQWSPIRYLYRSVPSDRLAAMYRDADVALVTPLRDGMNLVAKEFVACQTEDAGVLILSRLAGAAEHMHEALRVNPYNIDSVADNLHRALAMHADDRAIRLAGLQRRERRHDVEAWLHEYLDAARAPAVRMRPTTQHDFREWLDAYLATGTHSALFLDYDGTLTPIVSHPSEAHLGDDVRALLERCASRDDLDVTIVSGRALADVRRLVGLDTLTYAGTHGLEICGPRLEGFEHPDVRHYQMRAAYLAEELRKLCPEGAWVEEKGAALTLHMRALAPADREPLLERAGDVMQEAGFQSRPAHAALEAYPPIGWDKGHAVLHILRQRYGPAWSEHVRVICAGDDRTDEDAFRALSGLGITFRVGMTESPTLAARQLPDVEAVATLLAWLAERPVIATAPTATTALRRHLAAT